MRRTLLLLGAVGALVAAGMTAAEAQTTTTQDPYVPAGCYVTTHTYEGDQFGDTFAVTVKFKSGAQAPYDTHVVVTAQPHYWLMRVVGGSLDTHGQTVPVDWTNPDGVANRSYEFDAYGAAIGIRGIACPSICLSTPPTLPGTPGTPPPEPPCRLPPTTVANVQASSTTSSSTTSVEVTSTSAQAVTATSQPTANAVVATPRFTG